MEVKGPEHLVNLVRSLPWLAGHSIEIDDVVARLIAVGVLTYESGDVRRSLRSLDLILRGEEAVESLCKFFL